MMERKALLKAVQELDFALYDVSLYLDTHPQDPAALEYYKKTMVKRDHAKQAYVSKFGPICHSDYDGGPRWNWVDGPWPWQNKEA